MRLRVLGLGNDLLADDAFGLVAARALERQLPPDVEVVFSAAAGLSLLDALEGATHVLILDTWSRHGPPGAIYRANIRNDPGDLSLPDASLVSAPGSSLHYLGLVDALILGHRLGMAMPTDLACVAVEPSDCETVGGAMSDVVRAALPETLRMARAVLQGWRAAAVTR